MINLSTCSWVSVKRWEVRIILFFFFFIVSRKCQRSLLFRKSRPTNGSSSIRIFGSWRNESRIFSLTFCPPESWVGFLWMSSLSFRRVISSLALDRDWVSLSPRLSPNILMLSSIERSGMKANSWGTNPSLDLEKALLWPKILILPACFLEMIPATSFRKVDFPQPDLPMMLTSSPSLRFKVTSFRISLSV